MTRYRDAEQWFSANKLKININKTQQLVTTTKPIRQPATANLLGDWLWMKT